ncbi:N-acetylneuraminate synthase [Clostridium botulinum]|nr:N-acetylneuraminate synthase [Clostridium botulinum]
MNTYIIAEAGVNHNGNLDFAKLMIDKAKEAGVNCIKFQTFVSKNIVSKNASKAKYQKQYTTSNESQLDMLKKLELSFDEFKELKKYCDLKEIEFLSTAFDLDSINFLNGLGMRIWKIPSGEITNMPYLIEIAKTQKPVILSTGMSTLQEVEEAIEILRTNGCKDIKLLHCTTEYPAPYEEVNLKAMNTLKQKFDVQVGYSDHTKGTEVAIAAVAMGAKVIEKHFTLDRNMEGPDHKSSLEPKELKTMVNSIRNIEKAMGNGKKIPSPSERKNINIARKSIVAKCNIKKGEIFSEDNIITKRPGNGISPMRWFDIMGKTAIKDFEEDELIEI